MRNKPFPILHFLFGGALLIALLAVILSMCEPANGQQLRSYSSRTVDDGSGKACACVVRLPVGIKEARTAAGGLLSARPGEDGSARLILSWQAVGADDVEVRVGAPDGTLFSWGLANSWATGDWVRDGMVFYLQDVSNGRSLTRRNTIVMLEVRVGETQEAARRMQ